MMTRVQKEMLETLREHGGRIGKQSFRLTFGKDEEKWARDSGYVSMGRSNYFLTDEGHNALASTE